MADWSATEAQAERAIATLKRMIDGAQNSNQAAENAVVIAAAGLELFQAINDIEAALDGSPDYHYDGMGCGLEDRCITDRYQAMQYGWDEAIERAYAEHVVPAAEIARAAIAKATDA